MLTNAYLDSVLKVLGSDKLGRDESGGPRHTHILGEQHILISTVARIPIVRPSVGTPSAYICLINRIRHAIALGSTYIIFKGMPRPRLLSTISRMASAKK